jgi:integrase/recombinase XerD
MRSIKLNNPQYRLLEKGFENWLRTLNFADSTVYNSPAYLKAFFHFLEQNQVTDLHQVDKSHIRDYLAYLSQRKNQRRGGGLSVNYLTSNINALKRFSRYLRETRKQNLEVDIKLPLEKETAKTILTKAEILTLYKSCPVNDYRWKYTMIGLRDKAMLGVYYGCGLRRSEGLELDITDIDLNRSLVHVRKGKGSKERFVPIGESIKQDFKDWLSVRDQYLKQFQEQSFLLSPRGNRISGNALLIRLKRLVETAGINKDIGLHSLRHSIATHLLQQGMSLENVSRFLGHSSLENTQIYTHLKEENGHI